MKEGDRRRKESALYYLFLPNENDLKAACVCVCVCSVQGQLVTDGDLLCECVRGQVL